MVSPLCLLSSAGWDELEAAGEVPGAAAKMSPGREGVSDGELPGGGFVSPGENRVGRAELCLVQVGWCPAAQSP